MINKFLLAVLCVIQLIWLANIVILTRETGVRVQLYDRLTTALPQGFTPFGRLSRPFKIIQTVEDRDTGYNFYRHKLGFDTFLFGGPTL